MDISNESNNRLIESLYQFTKNIISFHYKSLSVITSKVKRFDSKIENIDFEQIFQE